MAGREPVMTHRDRPIVLKFGGSSLGSAHRLRTAAALVAEGSRRGPAVMVVSAMAGVTDALERAVEEACRGDRAWRRRVAALEERHMEALSGVTGRLPAGQACRSLHRRLRVLEAVLESLWKEGRCDNRRRAAALASGERLSVVLAAAALQREGLRASVLDGADLIVTRPAPGRPDDDVLEARPDLPLTSRNVLQRFGGLDPGTIAVATGFVAGDGSGGTVLLGRGGSDHTATLLAAALDARAVEIWTDVPGVLSAPPRWVPEATTVPRLSRAEAAALARWGGKVLHPRTLEPLEGTAVPVLVRSSLDPRGARTVVVPWGRRSSPSAICGRSGDFLIVAGGQGRPVLDPMDGRELGELVEGDSGERSEGKSLAVVVLVGEGWGPLLGRTIRILRLPVLGLVPELEPGAMGLVVRAFHLRRTVKALHDAMRRGAGRDVVPVSQVRALEVAS